MASPHANSRITASSARLSPGLAMDLGHACRRARPAGRSPSSWPPPRPAPRRPSPPGLGDQTSRSSARHGQSRCLPLPRRPLRRHQRARVPPRAACRRAPRRRRPPWDSSTPLSTARPAPRRPRRRPCRARPARPDASRGARASVAPSSKADAPLRPSARRVKTKSCPPIATTRRASKAPGARPRIWPEMRRLRPLSWSSITPATAARRRPRRRPGAVGEARPGTPRR